MYIKSLSLLTLATSIAASNAAFATEKTIAPVASETKNEVFEYSARKVLGYVSEASVAVNYKQKEIATDYIDEAIRELDSIRNTRDYLEMSGVRFGRVLYGTNSSYYIPIADETYAIRSYTNGPFWAGDKTTAVRDVEMISVNIAINPEKATSRLLSAKQKLSVNDYQGADGELIGMLNESIRETSATDQPFTRLQENIYLTRILIRQQNYDGARYTLSHAKAALFDYEKTVTAPEKRTSISNLQKEIDTLDNTIQRRDPTMLKQAADRVDQWWNDLRE